jgi:chemotaxis protein CheD
MRMAAIEPAGTMPSGLEARQGAIIVKVDPGAYAVTRQENHVLVTVLGSCIAACLRDPLAGIGGMNHFMLPSSAHGDWSGTPASLRYGNFAMEQLINDILRGGGARHRLQAKVFGGAAMLAGSGIGESNADFALSYLEAEGIRVVGSDLRGRHARCVQYEPISGRALMRSLPRADLEIARHESSYAASLARKPVEGTVELF